MRISWNTFSRSSIIVNLVTNKYNCLKPLSQKQGELRNEAERSEISTKRSNLIALRAENEKRVQQIEALQEKQKQLIEELRKQEIKAEILKEKRDLDIRVKEKRKAEKLKDEELKRNLMQSICNESIAFFESTFENLPKIRSIDGEIAKLQKKQMLSGSKSTKDDETFPEYNMEETIVKIKSLRSRLTNMAHNRS
ncbi:MAG: hypothetical protein MHMPM18_004156 [Marteilia pararefringens]